MTGPRFDREPRFPAREAAAVGGIGCLAFVLYLVVWAAVIAGGIYVVVWTLRALDVIA